MKLNILKKMKPKSKFFKQLFCLHLYRPMTEVPEMVIKYGSYARCLYICEECGKISLFDDTVY